MAAARVMVSASNTLTASLLSKGPLRRPNNFSLCFRNGPVQKRRLFTCSAIYNPQIQTIEEGQPETLDYRVFFADNSGKKVNTRLYLDSRFVVICVYIVRKFLHCNEMSPGRAD